MIIFNINYNLNKPLLACPDCGISVSLITVSEGTGRDDTTVMLTLLLFSGTS